MSAGRVLLFTGKGGVGKTSVAAATALRCADEGLRTMVLSTDPAHSLADSLDLPLGSVARPVAGTFDRLWAQELDAQERLEDVWADVQAYLMEILDWAGVDAVQAEELAVVPGLDEVFALADIKAYASSGEWDVVVVDCAPTAETIRFLSLPDILSWYMDRIFPVERKVTKMVRPLLARMTSMPVARDEVFAGIRRFYDRLDGVREILTDHRRSSVRLVVNPERMVIAEARRTATYLALFGYSVDAVVANRLLPEAVTDPWFKAWRETQAEHMATITDGFAPLPVLTAELATEELVGPERLRAFADELYGGSEAAADGAAAVLHDGEPMRIARDGDDTVLSLDLPFASADDLDLGRSDSELFVRVGPYRRAIVLPDSLRRRPVAGAGVSGGRLQVRFGAPVAAGDRP